MRLLFLALTLLLAACSPKRDSAPTSSLSKEQAKLVATAAKMLIPESGICSVAATHSMLPEFDSNAFLVVEKRGYGEVSVGDIIAYQNNGLVIVHKAVRKTDRGWIVRGVANDAEDPTPVTVDNFYGRVAVIIFSKP